MNKKQQIILPKFTQLLEEMRENIKLCLPISKLSSVQTFIAK